jgi:hypothetical protein
MTFGDTPIAITLKNHGRQDLIIVEVLVNGERPLTTVLEFGKPNRDFHAVTLAQGEQISLDCPLRGPVNEIVVKTDAGTKTFDFNE